MSRLSHFFSRAPQNKEPVSKFIPQERFGSTGISYPIWPQKNIFLFPGVINKQFCLGILDLDWQKKNGSAIKEFHDILKIRLNQASTHSVDVSEIIGVPGQKTPVYLVSDRADILTILNEAVKNAADDRQKFLKELRDNFLESNETNKSELRAS